MVVHSNMSFNRNVIQVKRSSVSGRAPSTEHLEHGELALNMADRVLYSTDGINVFELGANTTQTNTGEVKIRSQGKLFFYDSDNNNFLSLQSPEVIENDLTFTLPNNYGHSGAVLKTDGSGTLTWGTQTTTDTGGFTTSTTSVAPGSEIDYYDLSHDESGFSGDSTDAFGVPLTNLYDCMEPIGRTQTEDYGSTTQI